MTNVRFGSPSVPKLSPKSRAYRALRAGKSCFAQHRDVKSPKLRLFEMEPAQVNPWVLIGTSAAIGALVSSAIAEVGKWRERKTKREELLLTKAIEMAQVRFANMMTICKDTNTKANLQPEIEMAEDYHHYLKYLLERGTLPPDYKRNFQRGQDQRK
jgi:hypothetical protein